MPLGPSHDPPQPTRRRNRPQQFPGRAARGVRAADRRATPAGGRPGRPGRPGNPGAGHRAGAGVRTERRARRGPGCRRRRRRAGHRRPAGARRPHRAAGRHGLLPWPRGRSLGGGDAQFSRDRRRCAVDRAERHRRDGRRRQPTHARRRHRARRREAGRDDADADRAAGRGLSAARRPGAERDFYPRHAARHGQHRPGRPLRGRRRRPVGADHGDGAGRSGAGRGRGRQPHGAAGADRDRDRRPHVPGQRGRAEGRCVPGGDREAAGAVAGGAAAGGAGDAGRRGF